MWSFNRTAVVNQQSQTFTWRMAFSHTWLVLAQFSTQLLIALLDAWKENYYDEGPSHTTITILFTFEKSIQSIQMQFERDDWRFRKSLRLPCFAMLNVISWTRAVHVMFSLYVTTVVLVSLNWAKKQQRNIKIKTMKEQDALKRQQVQ